MKKQTMSLAVASALLVGGSSAFGQMYINERGTGEVLIYPYYSAANGNQTLIHVVNTTDDVKAVKVRFLEAENSQEVLDFNLYLSKRDHWSAAIIPIGDGAGIVTVDNSCTVPALGGPNNGFDGTTVTDPDTGLVTRTQPFVDFLYRNDPVSNTGIDRTLQGYVEIIEMGQLEGSELPPANFVDLNAYLADDANAKGHAATHNPAGVPNGCEKLIRAWDTVATDGRDGAWTSTSGSSELFSTWQGGGLYGYSTLLNVADGTAAGLDAIAIEEFAGSPPAGALHEQPGNTQPSLQDGIPLSTIFTNGAATDYLMDSSIDAVSSLIMHDTISNDFVADVGLRARTDWILTQPTKRDYVNGPGAPDQPYTDAWDLSPVKACEPVSIQFWDREELVTRVPGGFSPRPPGEETPGLQICTEVSIVGFGAQLGGAYDVNNTATRANADIFYGYQTASVTAGWAEMTLSGNGHELDGISLDDIGNPDRFVIFNGLPVLGSAIISYRNDDANDVVAGVLAAYASSTEHKTSVDVEDDGSAVPAP